MRFRYCFAIILVCLTGCAASGSKPASTYGNFAVSAPPAHVKQMADDAARQMPLLYPPASTRLDLRQTPADGFGKQLVELLRGQGYALQEARLAAGAPDAPGAPATPASPEVNAPGAVAGIAFNYVVDTIASPNLYRVTLILGSQAITRAYVPQSETIHPAGAWVRKE